MSEENYVVSSAPTKLADGFKTIYKSKVGGRRFADLLDVISNINPEMRIRFTSPHPKDFPDDVCVVFFFFTFWSRSAITWANLNFQVLFLIRDKHNICNQLHMPAQSGNDGVLNAMRRGYTREAYLNLVEKAKSVLPGTKYIFLLKAWSILDYQKQHGFDVVIQNPLRFKKHDLLWELL